MCGGDFSSKAAEGGHIFVGCMCVDEEKGDEKSDEVEG